MALGSAEEESDDEDLPELDEEEVHPALQEGDGEHATLEPARVVAEAAAEARALAQRAGFAGAAA